ncbi:ATP-binding protein [Streptomyces sp. NPDC051561]|uniref:ATP-binding protein n=1 Tax=Streptomyces sp. NPDC051561 TaxID=3365658 RepID=UPI00378C538B
MVVLRWGYGPREIGTARAELRKVLASWGTAASVEDSALLVLSELLTNAQRHGRIPGREVETRFLRLNGGAGVRLEVHDTSPRRPAPGAPDPYSCEGRGLLLVDGVADRWGVNDRSGPGKTVWAECTADGGAM